MKESPVKIDVLLESLLAAGDEQADQLLSQLITVHAEPVIKAVVRFKLRFSTNRETQRAEADDIQQDHYLLTRQRGFALWQDADGKLIAGYAVWQQQKPATHNLAGVEKLPKREELAETVASIFNYLNAPVEFDELVSSVAAIQGISDQPVESLTDDEDAVNEPVAPEPDQAVHTTEIRNTDSLPAHSPSTLIRLALRILVHAKRVSQ